MQSDGLIRDTPDKQPGCACSMLLLSNSALIMKRTSRHLIGLCLAVWAVAVVAQSGPAAGPGAGGPPSTTDGAPAQGQPVSYASVTELNGLLGQLESGSKNAQGDLAKVRVDRWKTDGSYKKQILANVESIQRNLQSALPEMIGKLRATPEDVPATFRLYRNLDALYDVMGSVVESVGAFGGKDEFQALSNDLNAFEGTRKQIAERIESLSSAKEAEITRLRTELKTAQAAKPVAPPQKTVVDDTAPAKKPPAKKKPVAKPTTPPATKPQTPATQTPPAQQAPAANPQ